MAVDISTWEAFQENKEIILAAFEKAIHDTLVAMGDDIHGIDWFCGRAEFHPKNIAAQKRGGGEMLCPKCGKEPPVLFYVRAVNIEVQKNPHFQGDDASCGEFSGFLKGGSDVLEDMDLYMAECACGVMWIHCVS